MVLPHHAWLPGLSNGELTLKDMLATLPGNKPIAIHPLIRLCENPASPLAFKGAITLPRHDAVHIVLGRGLMPQDEAFVVGFTMGTAKNLSAVEAFAFSRIARYLYPKAYRFNADHVKVYDLAVRYGKACAVERIYDFAFEEYGGATLKELRQELHIDITGLQEIYRQEQQLVPGTLESRRLPVG